MQHENIKYFQNTLTCWLEDLLMQGNNTIADLLDSTIKAVDLVDQASLETDRDFRLRIRDRESRLIGKIKQSLGKIEEGTFGICEACGEEISLQRLKARPVATYCITCKSKMEALENQ
jgi:DnaK suppressor protein